MYVGITDRALRIRWTQHVYDARKGSPSPLHAAVRKHGRFAFEIVELYSFETREEACKYEIALIAALETAGNGGYNASPGGDGGATMTGRRLSEETKKKMSVAAMGRIISPEQRAAVSARHKGTKKGPRPDAVKIKISLGNRLRWEERRDRAGKLPIYAD